MKSYVEKEVSEKGTWLDLVKIPSNRRALIAGVFLRTAQQMSGFMTFNAFAAFVFKKADTNISSRLSSIIYSSLLSLTTVFSLYTIAKFPRIKNFLYSSIASAIVLLSLAIYFFLEQNSMLDMTNVHWIPLGGMIIFIIVATFGYANLPTLMLSELFSTTIKSKALTVTTIINGATNFISNKLFYVLYAQFGLYVPFLLFSIFGFLSSIFVMKLLPETQGKTLGEIQQSMRDR